VIESQTTNPTNPAIHDAVTTATVGETTATTVIESQTTNPTKPAIHDAVTTATVEETTATTVIESQTTNPTKPAIHDAGTTTTDGGTTATTVPESQTMNPPNPGIHDAGSTTTDAGTATTTVTESQTTNSPNPAIHDAGTTTTDAGTTTTTVTETQTTTKQPLLHEAETTTTDVGTTATKTPDSESQPTLFVPPPPPLEGQESLQAPKVGTTATGTTQQKVAGQKRKYTKRAKVPVAQVVFKDELIDGDVPSGHGWRSQTRRELWQRGHQTASRPSRVANEVSLVMCDTVRECHTSMSMHGWAILRDITNAFGPKQQCTEQQRAFIDTYAIDNGLEVVFEDVIMNDRVDHYTPSFDKEHVNARVQLDMGRTGFQDIIL
jgi:hypothetical protein